LVQKGKKFLFDVNNFDEPDIPEPEENLPPPPPVFSLEELGQAKDEAFAQGKEAGLDEARHIREQYIAEQVNRIAGEIKGLQLSEQRREKQFEREVLSLCLAIFGKAFPALNARQGLEEVKAVVLGVLAHQPQSIIAVEVPESDLGEIQERLKALPEVDSELLSIRAGRDLETGSCRMLWEDGGAVRDREALAEAIVSQMEALLASPAKKNNNEPPSTENKGEE
jgi:flagellar assembly protein FliH